MIIDETLFLTKSPPAQVIETGDDSDGLKTWEKEIIHEGTFFKKSRNLKYTIDEMTLHHWANTHTIMASNGIKIPIYIEHKAHPDNRRGTLLKLLVKKNKSGKNALYGHFRFRDKDAEKLAASSDVSVFSPPKYEDGNGNRYVRPVLHVAITDYPLVPGLENFEPIAASLIDEEVSMSLQGVAEELGLRTADKEDSMLEKEIVALVNALKQEIEELKSQEEGDKESEEGGGGSEEGGGSEPNVSASMINMFHDNREMKIDRLVDQGKITPAVAKTIKKRHLDKKQLAVALSNDAFNDGFDALIETLEANEPVVSFNETSGGQNRRALSKQTSDEDNPLLKDMEARAAAAKR